MNKTNKKQQKHVWKKLIKILVILCIIILLGMIAGNFLLKIKTGNSLWQDYKMAAKEVKASSKETFRQNAASTFYDSEGNVITGASGEEGNTYLTYEELPENVVNAFVAVEDSSFWHNRGISLAGITRATLGYIGASDSKSGGSTITQQVAKNTFLTQEVSIDRKMKEICFALQMTKKYSKKEIIEFYCNQVCFANGIYGIYDAAEAYFGVKPEELSVSQVAYLCAIPNRPSYYDPYVDPTRAIARRDKILKNMYTQGYLSADAYKMAIQESITINGKKQEVSGYQLTYAKACAVAYLMEKENMTKDEATQALDTKGYRIYTSLNTKMQKEVQTSIDTNLSVDTNKDDKTQIYQLQGAAVVIDNATGNVTTIVGGRSQIAIEGAYSLNRAYQSYRQPGSAIKPLAVYTPALMKGYKAESIRSAVEQSTNSVATSVFSDITPKYGISFLHKMEFAKIVDTDEGLPSALGGLTYGVTPVEMAGAYRTFASHGSYQKPTCITSIQTMEGEELYQKAEETHIYDTKAADEMLDILKGVIKRGTAKSMHWSDATDVEAAGKTGTTNDNKDGWFCGVTPDYTMAVWVGCDTPEAVSDLQGSSYPASIWKECMLQFVNGTEKKEF